MLTFLAAVAVCTACAAPSLAGLLPRPAELEAEPAPRPNPWPALPPIVRGPVPYDHERAR